MSNSVQIAVDILTALLTGGFLLFFIETMHIESDVKHRFKAIMNPFYHSLSKMAVYIGHVRSSMTFPKTEKGELLKNYMEFVKQKGLVSLTSGRDIYFMKGDELSDLCYTINEIWHVLEEVPELRRDLIIHEGFGKDLASNALKEIYEEYADNPMDVDTLHAVTGAFFNEYWEPVEHCTPNFEYWEMKSKLSRILIFVALGISLVSLLLIMLWADCIGEVIPCSLAIATSLIFAVCIGMMAYLISLSNRLFRAA